jgi:hypothetical protein
MFLKVTARFKSIGDVSSFCMKEKQLFETVLCAFGTSFYNFKEHGKYSYITDTFSSENDKR